VVSHGRDIARLACLLTALPSALPAQQFVVDDVAIVEFRACQVEAWHGEAASWIVPACHFIPNVELSAGIGFVGHGGRDVEYVLPAKYMHIEPRPGGVGAGFVIGLGLGPLSQVTRDGVGGVFGYLPVTASIGDDRLLLHANPGARYDRGGRDHGDGAHHALTGGVRGDLALPVAADRFTLIGELFGEDRGRPEYQIGLRSAVLRDRLAVDVSWGGHAARGVRGIGWTFGAAWTPGG
jgi:hypothetical protein